MGGKLEADSRIWGHCCGLVCHPKGHYDAKQGSDADPVCLGGGGRRSRETRGNPSEAAELEAGMTLAWTPGLRSASGGKGS